MHRNIDKPATITSTYGDLRMEAQTVWRGPKHMGFYVNDNNSSYGWSVLSLEIKSGRGDIIDSRCVYAHLFNDEQQFALLRAVYWDGVSAKKAFRKHKGNYNLVLPARFVKLPVGKLKTWLMAFEGLSTTISKRTNNVEIVNIKRLRIEYDYVSPKFEQIWQIEEPEYAKLNDVWDKVWLDMTNTLLVEASITRFSEHFDFAISKFSYDFQTYRPDLVISL